MHFSRFLLAITLAGLCFACTKATTASGDNAQVASLSEWDAPVLPHPGDRLLRLISPTILELSLVTKKELETAPPDAWNFVDGQGQGRLPSAGTIQVLRGGKLIAVQRMGFKRRVLYAPLKQRDLRIANQLYLKLSERIKEGDELELISSDPRLWSKPALKVKVDAKRWTPVLHVNQTGYMASQAKICMAGFYLGSMGELDIKSELQPLNSSSQGETTFKLISDETGEEVFTGTLKRRKDRGWPFVTYQDVYEADFSAVKKPGNYRIFVAGLGCSSPFIIDDAVAGAFARTYALGLYHQRCGTDNSLPFSRFIHGPCHTRPAEVPNSTAKFKSANESLAKESANYKDNPRHTAPQLKSMAASLYPFMKTAPVDVRGGHHDAGDYSKYTINSAGFIHHLLTAADIFPGVIDLDNLGIPESGDGKSDVLQEVKWEADFLAKMQDLDGGFYFLVYPRDREYENDVTPDLGDPQIVFPKTTSATAAAVAALAQCASSPGLKKQFPEAAKDYLKAALNGWEFLERAMGKYGKDGAYQKITHYGDEFMHDDELAWAACELFLATQDSKYHKHLMEWLNPADPAIRRWGWWRLYEAYGCATRSYAFGARSGRVPVDKLNPLLLEACEREVAAAGEDHLRRASESAYGTSFPAETKRAMSAGWYFSGDASFDMAVACQLSYPEGNDPRRAMRAAILSNLNYEQGCNPVNVTYVTGLGYKRQQEIVHQYAQNDRRALPLSGIPVGNIQAGFGWNHVYNKELDVLSFPADGDKADPYPFYDRWGDGFNLTQEFVILNQARSLGYLCWLMAETSLRTQKWAKAAGTIVRDAKGTMELKCSDIDMTSARIIWEADGGQPVYGEKWSPAEGQRPKWVESEAQLPDGRRVFGVWPPGNAR